MGFLWFLGRLTQGEKMCENCENLGRGFVHEICIITQMDCQEGRDTISGCASKVDHGWKQRLFLKKTISDKGIPLLELSCQKKRWDEIQGFITLKLLVVLLTYGFVWIISLRYYSIKHSPSNLPLGCGLLDNRQCLSLDSSPGTQKKGLCKSAAQKTRKDKQGNVN